MKHCVNPPLVFYCGSLPTRERELKQSGGELIPRRVSLPTRERELKQSIDENELHAVKSLPTRERELKLGVQRHAREAPGRSPRGSVN